MVEVITAFFLLGGIIVIGYLGSLLFEKTKVSDLVILMLIGLLIGPIFNVLGSGTISLFKTITPFFAAIALMILLFEGGLHLNFYRVIRELSKSFLFTVTVFVLSMLFTALIMVLLGWELLLGLMLGAIIGGISSAVVIPLVNKTQSNEETKTLLNLESALTDALCVIVTITLIQIIFSESVSISAVGQSILSAFSIAAVIGFVIGLLWLKVLDKLQGRPYEYLLTIAVLFLLYVVVEYVGGNGAIAALLFGLVLGNSQQITSMLRLKQRVISPSIKSFQAELSFFIKTFFFVYLGIVFELSGLSILLVAVAIVLIMGLFLARFIVVKLAAKLDEKMKQDETIIQTMMARGLAAGVLASYPLTIGLPIGDKAGQIIVIVFLIILFSNIITTVGVFLSERGKTKETKIKQKIQVSIEDIETKQEKPKKNVSEKQFTVRKEIQ